MKLETQQLKEKWKQKGFEQPTVIQLQTFDAIRTKKDVVAISPTGTGKTLAYLLPLLDGMQANKELQCLIMAPSQELAQQIGQVASEWASVCSLTVQVLAGGANQKRQLEKLKNKPEIIVATPGRLKELSSSRKVKFHQLQTIVVDEADYLMQPEHLSTLRELIKKAPSQRQLLFFSATSSDEVQQLQKWFNVEEPLWITITPNEVETASNTTHGYIIVPTRKRTDELRRLAQVQGMQALVFVNGRVEADIISEKMAYHHIDVAVLHSEQTTSERKQAIESFKRFASQYLVVTDVAARGLDIENLPAVIHYDIPLDEKTYTHRSGRTGRMGKVGLVLSLVNDRELRELKKLVQQPLTQLHTYQGQLVHELPQQIESKPMEKRNKKKRQTSFKKNGKKGKSPITKRKV